MSRPGIRFDYGNEVSPCANCSERYKACHDTCEKYIAYRDRRLERKRKIRSEIHKEDVVLEGLYKRSTKRRFQR